MRSRGRLKLGLVLLVALLGSPAAAPAQVVKVVAGDSLAHIATRYGTTAGAIARANGLANPNLIRSGQLLVVGRSLGAAASPPAGTSAGGYTVRPGDTLAAIAARSGTSVGTLARLNGLQNPNVVVVGHRLRLSSGQVAFEGKPGAGGYVVRRGDTLGAIAARCGTSVAVLGQMNRLHNLNLVAVGRRLLVPAVRASVADLQPTRAEVASLLSHHAAVHGLDLALARAVAWQESGWQQRVRSSTGAIGVMQIEPYTAKWLGPAVLGRRIDPHRLSDNVEAGVALLTWLERRTGSRRLAIAAYYQGLGSVRRIGLLPETRRYVASVLSLVGRV